MNINDVALRRLSSRSRTVWEMKKYLCEKGFPTEDIDVVIEDFVDYGYLDDCRYCQEYFTYAFSKGKAKRRVTRELIEKGVSQQVIQSALEQYEGEINEYAMARREAEKILRIVDIEEGQGIPEKVLGRIARKLATYGYGADIIYSIIGELKK